MRTRYVTRPHIQRSLKVSIVTQSIKLIMQIDVYSQSLPHARGVRNQQYPSYILGSKHCTSGTSLSLKHIVSETFPQTISFCIEEYVYAHSQLSKQHKTYDHSLFFLCLTLHQKINLLDNNSKTYSSTSLFVTFWAYMED